MKPTIRELRFVEPGDVLDTDTVLDATEGRASWERVTAHYKSWEAFRDYVAADDQRQKDAGFPPLDRGDLRADFEKGKAQLAPCAPTEARTVPILRTVSTGEPD